MHRRDSVPTYAEIKSLDIEAVAQEFRRFVAVFRVLANSYNKFGLAEKVVSDAMPLLWRGVEDAIRTGLDRRKLAAEGPEERVSETLFFYPLVHKLWLLSHDLK